MNKERNKAIRNLFKSDWHVLRAFRLLGKRALYLGGLVKTIEHERIEEGINAGLKDKEIAEKLRICQKKVYRFRKELWNSKGK